MATSAKLVTDLSVVLRGMRSHEGVIRGHAAQAATDDVRRSLGATAATEQEVAAEVAHVAGALGAPAPRLRPAWIPSPTSLVVTAAAQAQPLGEALVAEAAAVRMLADRARVAHGLALAVHEGPVARATEKVSELYDDYADWLVRTATALVIDEEHADLRPTITQRLAGRAKDVVGLPARVGRTLVERVSPGARGAAGTDRALPLEGYDGFTAADATRASRELDSVDDLSALLAYESSHKDRRTVLDAGESRLAQLVG